MVHAVMYSANFPPLAEFSAMCKSNVGFGGERTVVAIPLFGRWVRLRAALAPVGEVEKVGAKDSAVSSTPTF